MQNDTRRFVSKIDHITLSSTVMRYIMISLVNISMNAFSNDKYKQII